MVVSMKRYWSFSFMGGMVVFAGMVVFGGHSGNGNVETVLKVAT